VSSWLVQHAQHQTQRSYIHTWPDAEPVAGGQDHFDGFRPDVGARAYLGQRELHRKLLRQSLPPLIEAVFARAVLLVERANGDPLCCCLATNWRQNLRRASRVLDMSPVSAIG
jgi:hypothetical protein